MVIELLTLIALRFGQFGYLAWCAVFFYLLVIEAINDYKKLGGMLVFLGVVVDMLHITLPVDRYGYLYWV